MITSLSIHFPQPSISLEFHVGYHLIQGDFLIQLCKKLGNRIAIISDSTLIKFYGNELSKGLSAQIFEIPCGEKAKTREVKQMIEDQLLNAGYGRDTVIIGLGGGSTTDLAGFVASTYLRGVSLILIPTSLLAMVDASIGGKTAIDTHFGKNLIGAFYHPKAIICDLEMLYTLPEKEKMNGFSEILKMGLVFDSEILKLAETSNSLEELVIKTSKAKIAVITQDPFENGRRRILNFGHTIGHALESISDFAITHGEAVVLGCIAESHLSVQLGYLAQEQFFQIEKIYKETFGSIQLPRMYQRKILLQAMAFDKKKSVDGIRFVLIDKIGHAISFDGEYCRVVNEKDLEATLSFMEEHYG